ncbi:hypothetical protein [Halorientalis pallida]|uniref:Uncharacterized protein n=1 Tax=Halorientalis pallida TaxID=2479928 RepID=A0A498KY28_9EURY|nr:hypothetical protein [Halorientalis pallida]RXK50551.1 hypothetical protein EAF64_08370 [Halorientalis pallida]
MSETNPLADRRIRGAIGLSGALVVVFVAYFFLEGTVQLVAYGIAVLDAIVTPIVLGKAVEQNEPAEEEDPSRVG